MEANKIIITGGATRIGAAIARKLSGKGVEIVIHFNKSKVKAEKLKKELSTNGTKVYLVKGDLSVENNVNNLSCMRRKFVNNFLWWLNESSNKLVNVFPTSDLRYS